MAKLPSLYERFEKDEEEKFLFEELSEEEKVAELDRLEGAYARFLAGTYRTWSPQRRYANDRGSILYQCLQVRRVISQASDGYEGLTGSDLSWFVNTRWQSLRGRQRELVQLRSTYYSALSFGTA